LHTDNGSTKIPQITLRKKEILQLIEKGLTNAQISEKLFISVPTVSTHRQSLLNKFEVNNTASLLKLASKYGLV
jgi:DNA-binding CsgD family transcriptional regulator